MKYIHIHSHVRKRNISIFLIYVLVTQYCLYGCIKCIQNSRKKRRNFVSNKNKNTNWIANTFLSKNWVNKWRDKTEVRLLNEKEKTFSQSIEAMRFIYGIIKKSEKRWNKRLCEKHVPCIYMRNKAYGVYLTPFVFNYHNVFTLFANALHIFWLFQVKWFFNEIYANVVEEVTLDIIHT